MESVPKRALKAAKERGLDLRVDPMTISTAPYKFRCLKPKASVLEAFEKARERGQEWVPGMPVPVVTYHSKRNEWEIMDGMMRICAAIMAGYEVIPALVAKGETYDALDDILREGYYGEDFVEMLSMVNPDVARNCRLTDDLKLSGV